MLCVWDMRQGSTPFSLMEAHSAESTTQREELDSALDLSFSKSCFIFFYTVWEVHFHPTNPDHLFTCSEDGSLLHWETSSQSDIPSFLQGDSHYFVSYSVNPEQRLEPSIDREITKLLPTAVANSSVAISVAKGVNQHVVFSLFTRWSE